MPVKLQLWLVVISVLSLLAGGACTGRIENPAAGKESRSGSGAGGQGASVAANCPVGQVACAGACVDAQSDGANCGACGVACAAGALCQAGQCRAYCSPGQLDCGGSCSTVQSELSNCGACGVACALGEFCSAGTCSAVCAFQVCDGKTGLECADIGTNPDHCGGCGAACAPGQECVQGVCRLSCPEGRTPCAGQCVETQTNAAHCGSCGSACAPGVGCITGACGCPAGQALCGGVCVDVQSEPAHCGACGKACTASELCEAGACKPKSAGCSQGLLQCSAACVDATTSNTHCGTCNNPCTAGRSCSAGQCQCPAGQLFCEGACVDVSSSEAHCGKCGVECTAGRTCAQGECECDAGQTFCGAACVDTGVSNEHCGKCGKPCSGGQSCGAGQCVCPGALEFCDGTCLDTGSTDAHCGKCDSPCALGKSCVNGECTGSGGIGEDGCQGLAKNVTVSQVAVYQTVKIPVMNAGAAVAASSRNTDIVAGRETMFRVFVSLADGFAARELSARLVLMNGETPSNFYQKKIISKASDDADASSTFQLFVPAAEILSTTKYHVELVECTAATGTIVSPRFPSGDAEAELGARETGPLKVKIIPVQANSRTPDTSSTALEVYRSLLAAMYPVEAVELSVGSSISTSYPVDWGATLDQVRAKRAEEAPAADVYYYGLLKPADSLDQFCNGSCTTGIGYVTPASQPDTRVAIGIGFADGASADTMAHELGHNHGRNHAPCGGPSGVDGSYPYDNAGIGSWGYDARTKLLYSPTGNTDIMGYCSNKWISDYTYDALVSRVAYVNGVAPLAAPSAWLSTFRVLLLDSRGPRWGLPVTQLSLPSGEPELAEVLDAYGSVITLVQVYRNRIPDIDAAMIMVPEPASGYHAVRVDGFPPLAYDAPVAVPAP